ncbi:Modification methylase HphIA (M.HphIA) (Cytosine-specific methyltransferase HphIA) (M.Hphi(C)) [Durusdinium trenchii]|uniref:DNA (cytosine-5-)-methyltransferase n=1 Tax=Durusdinium trenchii TaxID=1381693 RepID=A0ABP0R1Q4_9DINO
MATQQRIFWFDERPGTLPADREIIVDCFAGGGGASLGITRATGLPVDVAANHDKSAIAMHLANHPETRHYCENLWDLDPEDVTEGRPVGLAWFSPDCTHFSKAKGSKPREERVRALAWIVVRWAARVRPRVILLENVEEFADWGPLRNGRPVKSKRGITFSQWCNQLRELGYRVEWRILTASDYGAPTTRKRLFLVARCDGEPIVWPEPTHGSPQAIRKQIQRQGWSRLQKWRPASEIIDWSIPCPSIFLSTSEAKAIGCKRPLADKTMKRIAEGIRRYVIETSDPFIVRVNHGSDHFRGQSIDDPLATVTGRNGFGVICPQLMSYYGERPGQRGRGRLIESPVPTVVTENRIALVSAFIAKHFGGMVGTEINRPFPTVTERGAQNQLVAATLVKNNHGGKQVFDVAEPLRTVCAQGTHHALVECRVEQVRAFLWKYYGSGGQWNSLNEPAPTITVRDRLALGLVTIGGTPWQIVDIGMRMLTPRELFRAQGFPDSYEIEIGVNGKPATKSAQVGRCGNSVCPDVVIALVRANFRVQPVGRAQQAEMENLGDFHSGFRAYRREVLETIPWEENTDDFAFDSQVLAQSVYFGFKLGDIPVPVRYFDEASSINFRRSVKYGLTTVTILLQYWLQCLKLFRFRIFRRNRK